jgi:transcriptional regulator with XRE-family HTH domain
VNGIRLARLRSGLSQDELAEKSGIPARTISNLEDGQHVPRAKTLAKLAAALEVDTLELLLGFSDRDGARRLPRPETSTKEAMR